MPGQLRIVADPNVWVSALISPSGAPADVLRAVLADEVVAVATPHLLDELAAVLSRNKFRHWVTADDAAAYVDGLASKVDLRPETAVVSRSTRDPDDDYLVAIAEDSGAMLVTGDDDLLAADLDPPAITPRALLNRLRSQS